MDYFYDGQIRRYLSQFINVMSNFAYRDAKGSLTRVPVRYGDMTRQVAQLLRKNSENAIPSAPFIACYIKDIQFDRPRLQDPTFVSKIHIRERDINTATNTYINTQGNNYTVERIMPSPYLLSLNADIWTTSAEQKLQLWEQIVVFFNPSLEIQTTDNYVDWTSLSVLHLESQVWTTRAVPQGINEDIDILSLTFSAPVWITPPAKVRKLGIVTKIISNLFAENIEGPIKTAYDRTGESAIFNDFSPDEEITVTPGNYELLVLNGTARLISQAISNSGIDITDPRNSTSWHTILNMYPGKFRASLTQLRFAKAGENEVVATISLDPSDDKSMILSVDQDTIPSNTILSGRGTIDAIVNPITYKPSGVTAGTRFLILEGLNLSSDFGQPGYDGPVAWKNADGSDFRAHANDIISWNGTNWGIVFDSTTATGVIYVTNSYTGTQYQFENGDWVKSYEGVYQNKLWRLIL